MDRAEAVCHRYVAVIAPDCVGVDRQRRSAAINWRQAVQHCLKNITCCTHLPRFTQRSRGRRCVEPSGRRGSRGGVGNRRGGDGNRRKLRPSQAAADHCQPAAPELPHDSSLQAAADHWTAAALELALELTCRRDAEEPENPLAAAPPPELATRFLRSRFLRFRVFFC